MNTSISQESYNALELRVTRVELGLQENTLVTKSIKNDTSEMVEAYNAVKGGFKVLETLGKIAKPFIAISAAFGAAAVSWAMFKANIAQIIVGVLK